MLYHPKKLAFACALILTTLGQSDAVQGQCTGSSHFPYPAEPVYSSGSQLVGPPVAPPTTVPNKPIIRTSVPELFLGKTYVVNGTLLGERSGMVELRIGETKYKLDVFSWSENRVEFQMPKQVVLSSPMISNLVVFRNNGDAARKLKVIVKNHVGIEPVEQAPIVVASN